MDPSTLNIRNPVTKWKQHSLQGLCWLHFQISHTNLKFKQMQVNCNLDLVSHISKRAILLYFIHENCKTHCTEQKLATTFYIVDNLGILYTGPKIKYAQITAMTKQTCNRGSCSNSRILWMDVKNHCLVIKIPMRTLQQTTDSASNK